jgi:two-component system nitrate/nitrite sensor histidine kinase NarX
VALENTRLRDQVQELAIVEERTRLSREMHDSLGQVLAYVRLEADEISRLLADGEAASAAAKVAEVGKAVSEASEEVRHAILALRMPSPSEMELPKMLGPYLESFRAQTGIEVSLEVRSDAAVHFAPRAALQLVRVLQEALSNVRKHAAASCAGLTFDSRHDEAVLTVSDDGVGFNVSRVYTGGRHFGIQVMTERMEALGGSLEIDSAAGQGTRVTARLPLEGNLGEQ